MASSNMLQKPDFERFLKTPEPAELGPKKRPATQPKEALEEQLALLLKESSYSEEQGKLIEALILLWHDHLDAAHEIAQAVDTPDGAFVHGIMHRREPDFGNAAYWFRRVGVHPAFPRIATAVSEMLRLQHQPKLAVRLIRNQQWDPFAFIEACEEMSGKPEERLLRDIQKMEFEGLLASIQNG